MKGVLGTPDSGHGRDVDMSNQLSTTLRQLSVTRKKQTLKRAWREVPPWIFCSASGELLDEANVRRAFRRVLKAAGLPLPFSPHCLRHTYALLLLQQGESPEYVKRQLGHASIELTVDTYGKWLPRGNKAAVDRLDDDANDSKSEQTAAARRKAARNYLKKQKLPAGIEPATCCLENRPCSSSRGQEFESDLVAEPFESANATADGALGLAWVEVGGTELVVRGASSDESVSNDQDERADDLLAPPVGRRNPYARSYRLLAHVQPTAPLCDSFHGPSFTASRRSLDYWSLPVVLAATIRGTRSANVPLIADSTPVPSRFDVHRKATKLYNIFIRRGWAAGPSPLITNQPDPSFRISAT
jgi:hypothetical protein